MPAYLQSILSRQVTGKPLSKEPTSDFWQAPQYEAAETYVHNACKAWKEWFWIGSWVDKPIFGAACGYVECHETIDNMSGDLDVTGYGNMEWDGGRVEFFVLGAVEGSGTAILLDKQGNLWIYNHPDTIDPPHECFREVKAAIILPAGESAVKNKQIVLSNVVENVKVTFSRANDEENPGGTRKDNQRASEI